jgi:phage gpG-like protein
MSDATFKGTRDQLKRRLRAIRAALSGSGRVRVPGLNPAALVLQRALGVRMLSLVQDAYVVKARGGTDACGITWAKLSPKTIAYSRRHPELTRRRKYAARQGRSSRPLLSAAEDARWRAIYARELARQRTAGHADAEGAAAALAWSVLKREGAQTILGKYGTADVEILRDTGRLLASFSPGSRDNVLDVKRGLVRVGTNVVYARTHHEGRGKIPARPFWPSEGNLPEAWVDELKQVFSQGMTNMVRAALEGGEGG